MVALQHASDALQSLVHGQMHPDIGVPLFINDIAPATLPRWISSMRLIALSSTTVRLESQP